MAIIRHMIRPSENVCCIENFLVFSFDHLFCKYDTITYTNIVNKNSSTNSTKKYKNCIRMLMTIWYDINTKILIIYFLNSN